MSEHDQSQFSSEFQQALSSDDKHFGKFIQETHLLLLLSDQARGMDSSPGSSLYQALDDPFAKGLLGLSAIDIIPLAPDHRFYSHRTGISSHIPVQGSGKSVSGYRNGYLRLSGDMCSSCSASHLSESYSCSDLSDPKQIRGGQLMRMAIGLHEMGHAVFEKMVMFGRDFTREQKGAFFEDRRLKESFSDALSLLVIMKELGPEGIAFAKQYVGGFRDRTNATGDEHDTSNMLAGLVSQAERQPDFLRSLTLEKLVDKALKSSQESLPEGVDEAYLEQKFSKLGLHSPEGRDSVAFARSRLSWYKQEKAHLALGQEVDPKLLDLYERYALEGDKLMMTDTELKANLDHMIDLGPLKGALSELGKASEAELSCQAKRGPRSSLAPTKISSEVR